MGAVHSLWHRHWPRERPDGAAARGCRSQEIWAPLNGDLPPWRYRLGRLRSDDVHGDLQADFGHRRRGGHFQVWDVQLRGCLPLLASLCRMYRSKVCMLGGAAMARASVHCQCRATTYECSDLGLGERQPVDGPTWRTLPLVIWLD